MKNTSIINTANSGKNVSAVSAGADLASVRILSLNFRHTPSDPTCSAVYCRDTNNVFTGPEWKIGDTTVKPIVYIAEQLQRIDIAINVNFTAREGRTSGSYPVTLYLLNSDRSIFSGELSAEYMLAAGENSIVFSIPEPKIKNDYAITNYLSKFKFSFSCGEQQQTSIQEFLLEIYVLPKTPTNPISLFEGNEDYYPNIDFINTIFTSIPGYVPEEDPMQDVMKRLYSNPYLKFVTNNNDMEKFSTIYHELTPVDPKEKPLKTDVIQFDFAKFFNAYNKTSSYLKVDSEVYAVLLMYGFCLFGKDAVVSHIIPFVDDDNKSSPFITKELYAAGFDNVLSKFELKYQTVVESNGLIYDASLKYMPEMPVQGIYGESLFGLPFEKDEYNEEEGYVNKVFVDKTEAMPGGITNDLSVNGMVCQITPVQDED